MSDDHKGPPPFGMSQGCRQEQATTFAELKELVYSFAGRSAKIDAFEGRLARVEFRLDEIVGDLAKENFPRRVLVLEMTVEQIVKTGTETALAVKNIEGGIRDLQTLVSQGKGASKAIAVGYDVLKFVAGGGAGVLLSWLLTHH